MAKIKIHLPPPPKKKKKLKWTDYFKNKLNLKLYGFTNLCSYFWWAHFESWMKHIKQVYTKHMQEQNFYLHNILSLNNKDQKKRTLPYSSCSSSGSVRSSIILGTSVMTNYTCFIAFCKFKLFFIILYSAFKNKIKK